MLPLSILFNGIVSELATNPMVILSIFGIVMMFLGVVKKANEWLLTAGLLGLLGGWAISILNWDTHIPHFRMLTFDNMSLAMLATAIAFTILIFLLTDHKEYEEWSNRAEFYALFFFSLTGVALMLSYSNLLILFIGIEILSISSYIMAGFRKKDLLSNEASLKYFLMGSFATGFLLMGIALIYGSTGSFDLPTIHAMGKGLGNNISPLYLIGIILLIVAMAFKTSIAPFHFWAPDVYQGAPTAATAYMSTVVKLAGFGAFYRLMFGAFQFSEYSWSSTIVAMIALTLILSNLIATRQHNFKRLLAYSSISHAGFMLMSVLYSVHSIEASGNLLLYIVGYGAASIIAFGALQLVHYKTGSDEIEAFNGLAKRNPFLAICLVLAMCSMAGIPLTAGFFGKFYMLKGIIDQGHLWLAIVAVLFSAVSFYYYFAVIKAMYLTPNEDAETIALNPYQIFLFGIASLAILVFGVMPMLIKGLL